jgi:hypothetical protein
MQWILLAPRYFKAHHQVSDLCLRSLFIHGKSPIFCSFKWKSLYNSHNTSPYVVILQTTNLAGLMKHTGWYFNWGVHDSWWISFGLSGWWSWRSADREPLSVVPWHPYEVMLSPYVLPRLSFGYALIWSVQTRCLRTIQWGCTRALIYLNLLSLGEFQLYLIVSCELFWPELEEFKSWLICNYAVQRQQAAGLRLFQPNL